MLNSRLKQAFTLIELLVVIAIIAILSAIILVFLGGARTKSGDAAVQADMNQAQTEAAFFYDTNSTYYDGTAGFDVCSITIAINDKGMHSKLVAVAGAPVSTVKSVYNFVLAAGKITGISSVTTGTASGPGIATCNRIATAWAAEVPLSSSGYRCVDSVGHATSSPSYRLTSAAITACY